MSKTYKRTWRLSLLKTANIVLLIDEIDKSDIDLPNDLLNIFEEGEFEIRELAHSASATGEPVSVAIAPYDAQPGERVPIYNGKIRCTAFPIVIMTSNGERDFPPAFRRRCLRFTIEQPNLLELEKIVRGRFDIELAKSPELLANLEVLLKIFDERRSSGTLATDQLLNAVFLSSVNIPVTEDNDLREVLLNHLAKWYE